MKRNQISGIQMYLAALLVVAALAAGIQARAQTAQDEVSVEKLQEEMKQKTANVETVSCDFVQNKHLQYLDAVVSSKGKLWFDRNNRLRWEYFTPFQYLIVINKGKFSIKTDGRVNEFDTNSNAFFVQMSDLIISSVNGSIFTNPGFDVKAYKAKGEYLISMQPRNAEMKKVLSRIKLYVNVADFSVNKVDMYEKEDDFTEIIFQNKKFNEVFPEKTFYCN